MQTEQPGESGAAPLDQYRRDAPSFVPVIDVNDIFRDMISQELRDGRLTPAHRRRIVDYAARMGFSAVQAGRLIESCRDEALVHGDATERRHALRLIEPPPGQVAQTVKIVMFLVALIAFGLLLVRLSW